MSFPINNLSSLGRKLLSVAAKVRSNSAAARRERGYLPPLSSTRKEAQAAVRKGMEGIARVAREGDQAAKIELKHRKGYFR